MENINGTDEICDTTPNSDTLPGPAQNALAFAHRYIQHHDVFTVLSCHVYYSADVTVWPDALTVTVVFLIDCTQTTLEYIICFEFFSVFWGTEVCTSLLLCPSFHLHAPIYVACQHGSELPLFTAALSCFSSLGSSLRLVGSALSDRDVITSPDYCNIITTQSKKSSGANFLKNKSLIAGQQQGGSSLQNLMHCLFTNC